MMHLGRAPEEYFGIVNPPIVRASSILYKSLQEYYDTDYRYARNGTPLSRHLQAAITKLEGGFGAITASSGFSAITTAIFAFAKAGDHILVTDALYPPVRAFCDTVLSRLGIETEYYDPLIGAKIEKLCRKNTALIYMESPGSGTFELTDVPAITRVAKKKKIVTVFDDSWSGGVLYKPFRHGVDVVVQSLTKYIGGHADVILGAAVAADRKHYSILREMADNLGVCGGADEMYLVLRGLRTVKIRLKQHAENALKVARWLEKQPQVRRVYYPPLPGHSTHKIWKRDFSGANGLFSVLLKPASRAAVSAFVNALELFPVANSWGGYESLLQPQAMDNRAVMKWKEKGALLRLHIGLEDPDDLIADLKQGLKKLR